MRHDKTVASVHILVRLRAREGRKYSVENRGVRLSNMRALSMNEGAIAKIC